MSVQEIKEAVRRRSLEERAEVAACLHSWNDDEWDEQMKRDLAGGKLDTILARVDADMAENKTRGMP
jgi:phage shock protein A